MQQLLPLCIRIFINEPVSLHRYFKLFNILIMMTKKRYYTTLLMLCFALLSNQLQAQEYTQKVLAKLPELKVGKEYKGQDVRKSKDLFPEGVAIEDEVVYPFAKIIGRKAVVVLYFKSDTQGKIIYMHATTLRKKNLQPIHVSHYLYTHGKVNSSVYTSTLSINKKGVVTFNEIENGKKKVSKYRIEGKRFSYVTD